MNVLSLSKDNNQKTILKNHPKRLSNEFRDPKFKSDVLDLSSR